MGPHIRRLAKTAGFTILFLLSLEVILRITGFVLVTDKTDQKILAEDENKIRILALGESTTDERFANHRSWTNQLEKRLNSRGYKVKIYNVARVGSNTALLLSRVNDQLAIYRPHIVMTMMGINDSETMAYDYAEPSLKVQKLFRIVKERIQSVMSCEVETVQPRHFDKETIKAWLPLTSKDKLPELEKEIRNRGSNDKEVATTLTLLASLIKNRHFPYDVSEFIHLMDRSHELHPMNDVNMRIMMGVLTGQKNPRCMKFAKELLPCGVNLSDEFLKHISDCHSVANTPLSIKDLEIKGLSFMNGIGFTAHHYQILESTLKKKNISLVAMQYPTLPLENLKLNFSDPKGIVFVSNEENFREALKKYKFHEIYRDNFRATWGHTTEFGHSLIAESAMKEIEPLVVKLSGR